MGLFKGRLPLPNIKQGTIVARVHTHTTALRHPANVRLCLNINVTGAHTSRYTLI